MRIFSITVLTVAILGSAVTPGWCPEPPRYLRETINTGRTGAAVYYDKPAQLPKPLDPKTMTHSQRQMLLSREISAGRIRTKQDAQNFLRTGDAKTPYTPLPSKPLPPGATKPAGAVANAMGPNPANAVATVAAARQRCDGASTGDAVKG
jgi:hypothetical protein